MKKTIILISILILIFSGILLSNETKLPVQIQESKIMQIEGKIYAIMTDIPMTQDPGQGQLKAIVKVKVKDDKTGQEHSIQIAPENFLKLNGIFLQKNDPIKIKAFKSGNANEIKSLDINIKGKVLKLRDKFGKGLWEKPQNVFKKRSPYKK